MSEELRRHVDTNGTVRYHNKDGKLHRLDGPALERRNGSKEWYQNGEYHRLDGPALERSNGYKEWYQNGKLHRLDGPAYEGSDGYKEWYIEGKYYRTEKEWKKICCPSVEEIAAMFNALTTAQ